MKNRPEFPEGNPERGVLRMHKIGSRPMLSVVRKDPVGNIRKLRANVERPRDAARAQEGRHPRETILQWQELERVDSMRDKPYDGKC